MCLLFLNSVLVLVFTKEINGIIAKYYEPTAVEKDDKDRKEYHMLYTIIEVMDGIDDEEDA